MRHLFLVLFVALALGCASEPYRSRVAVTVPAQYSAGDVTRALAVFHEAWVEAGNPEVNQPVLFITIRSESDAYYGTQNFTDITVYDRGGKLSDSALVHELIHAYLFWSTRDPDAKHESELWGEGFESPVKRKLAGLGL